MTRIVLIAIYVCLFFSCNTKSDGDVGSTEFVEVTLDDSDGQFTEFIGLVDSIALIQLQTREDFLLGIIGQAHFTDDRIYVLDIAHAIERPLIVYDRSGTPLFRVGSRGRGPGEYLDIAGLEVTEEYIIVHDGAMSSVLVYDLNGVFKYSWELERFPWDIAKLDDQTLVEHDGAGTLTFTDLKGKALHSHSVDTKGIIEIRTAFSRQDDNLNFIDPINQRVWRVTADSLIPYRHIDLGKWQIPPDYYDRFQGKPPVNLHMNVQQRTGFDTDYGLFASFMENSMWDFYVFSMRMLPFNYLFRNKATGKKNFVKFGTGGEGDYDEGFKTLGIGSVMGSLGDMFVMTVSPSELLEFRDDDRVADPMLLRLQERVKKMEIREDDNNLLLLYRVKDPL